MSEEVITPEQEVEKFKSIFFSTINIGALLLFISNMSLLVKTYQTTGVLDITQEMVTNLFTVGASVYIAYRRTFGVNEKLKFGF